MDHWVAETARVLARFNAASFAVDLHTFGDAEFIESADMPSTLLFVVVRRGELLYAADEWRPPPPAATPDVFAIGPRQ